MILQALKEYYDRKAADSDSGIAPLGWERKEIPYLIVICNDGLLARVEDTQELVGKNKRAKTFLVPQSVKRSSGVASNLLWDNVEYATGVVCKGKSDRAAAQHKAFVERLSELSDCPSVAPILAFLSRPDYKDQLASCPEWKDAVEGCAFVTFKLVGEFQPVCGAPDVVAKVNANNTPDDGTTAKSFCLVSGDCDVVARLHPAIKGVRDTKTTGANIVSFNSKAVCSHGKSQGENAPVGERAAFKYTTALNMLLAKDSHQKMTVGDATAVFWSERKTILEDEFIHLFGEPEKDNPDKGIAAIERLLTSVRTGSFSPEDDTTRFYVLGLAPSDKVRLSVRFWHVGTVAEMERRFAYWFENLQIVHGPKDKEHLSLTRLLLSTAPYNKDFQKWKSNISPNLAGAVMRSILEGTPYPATLLSSAILRTKAEHEVTYPRAKLIKAFLNNNLNQERKLTVSLDKENANVGYRLGRLFAVLEQIQLAANDYKSPNATIRDKFYAAASSTPATVFGNLMRLKNHHLAKLSKTGFYEGLIGEILYRDSEQPGVQSFPSHLSLQDQGMFAIGYYHQRQDFFSGKQAKTADDSLQNTKSAT